MTPQTSRGTLRDIRHSFINFQAFGNEVPEVKLKNITNSNSDYFFDWLDSKYHY
jgi:hypothetical protein